MLNTDLAHAVKSSDLTGSLISTQWDSQTLEIHTVSSPDLLQVSVCCSCEETAVRTQTVWTDGSTYWEHVWYVNPFFESNGSGVDS